MKTTWIRDDQNFKLKFGSDNNNWVTVTLADSVDTSALHDGVYLSENANGKYEVAQAGDKIAYPMLELKFQFDNEAVEGVTVSEGKVQAFTKYFEGTPSAGDLMKIVDSSTDETIAGSLTPLEETDETDLAVAEVISVHSGDGGSYLEISKLY